MSILPSSPQSPDGALHYSATVTASFSAAHSLPGLEPGHRAGRPHRHDFTATFTFATATLSYPGVVVDDDMRTEIIRPIENVLDHRDLDRLPDRPATCEAIAEHLATWHSRSARPPGHAQLLSVSVTTARGLNGTVHLPGPFGGAR